MGDATGPDMPAGCLRCPPAPRRLAQIACAAALAVVSAVSAAQAATQAPADETVPMLGSCRFDLPAKVITIVHQASSGRLHSDFRVPRSTTRVGRHEVIVEKEISPVFVVLTGGESIEWDLRIQSGAKVAGIYVLGLGDQVVTGVPADVRLGFSIVRASGSINSDEGQGCPDLSRERMNLDLRSVERLLSREFGRTIDKAHVAEPIPCPYQECLSIAGQNGSWWARLFGGRRAPTKAQAADVRASGSFVVRNDSQ
jgi:hypothetical protein